MASRALTVWQNRKVIGLLVSRDLKVKYQKSFLGYAWSLLEPLAMASVYYFIFGVILHASRGMPGDGDAPGGYPLFLLSGLLPWLWCSGALTESPKAMLSHGKLITTMKVPREIFPIATVCTKFVDYLATWPVLLVFVWLLGGTTSVVGVLGWLPLALIVQLLFTLGITFLLSSVNILFRDIERLIRVLNRVLFYGSAIIYPAQRVLDPDLVPDWAKVVYQLNPLVGIFQMHHQVWFPAALYSDEGGLYTLSLVSAIGGAVLMFTIGYAVFRRLETAVLKEL